MEKLIKKVSILKEKGLFHIFGTSIINYIILSILIFLLELTSTALMEQYLADI